MEDRPEGNVNTLAIEVPLSGLEIREDSAPIFIPRTFRSCEYQDKTGTVVEHFSGIFTPRSLKNIG